MSDDINQAADRSAEDVPAGTGPDKSSNEMPFEMSVNAASLASAEDEEITAGAGEGRAESDLSVNAAALATSDDMSDAAEEEAGAEDSSEPGLAERVTTAASNVMHRVVDEAVEVAEMAMNALDRTPEATEEGETLAEARAEEQESGATGSTGEEPAASSSGAADAEEGSESAEPAMADSDTGEAENSSTEARSSRDEIEEIAESSPFEDVERLSGVDPLPPTTEVTPRQEGEMAETGEAAAVSMPTSEAEADAEIEAAGVEAVAEGRSPASVEVTEQGEVADEAMATTVVGTAEAAADTTGAAAESGAAATEEGQEEAKKPRRRRKRQRSDKRRLDSFKVGEETEGTVRSIQPYGAFVDVGAERDGLVHISELRDGFVEKVEDVVKEGDTVTVRVKEVDTERGRLSLTMRSEQAIQEQEEQKQRLRLRDLSEGQEFLGTVTSIVDFGAFVDIGARTDGLVHISELSEDRVNRVSDVVSEGQEVTVRVLGVDRKRNRISLTMREAVNEEEFVYEEEDSGEEPPSLMELAFARARARARKEERRSGKQGKNAQNEGTQIDDIIERTLRSHGES